MVGWNDIGVVSDGSMDKNEMREVGNGLARWIHSLR